MMGVHTHRIVFVDCHSAALLALTRAATYIDDPRLLMAIDRGLAIFAIETTNINWEGNLRKIDVVSVDWVNDADVRHTNTGFWTYHAGLMLRFFAALRASPNAALQAIAASHRERIELFEIMIRRSLSKSFTRYDDMIELRSSIFSGETNSETQPWAAIGLMERGWTR
jgi:hypothetical protein